MMLLICIFNKIFSILINIYIFIYILPFLASSEINLLLEIAILSNIDYFIIKSFLTSSMKFFLIIISFF